jgi:hypothetical protein
MVADQPAREANQDRREGRQPRPLRHVPAGRGRGVATDVRRDPVADRPTPGTTRARMTGRRDQMRHTTTLDVRLEHGETREFQSGKPARPVILPAKRVGCDRISLPRPSVRRKIMPIGTGIGGMSVHICRDGKRVN